LPDWLAGILAEGIIKGSRITEGRGSLQDAMFIIIATLVSTYLVIVILSLIWAIGTFMLG
jgi:hypothetical protein